MTRAFAGRARSARPTRSQLMRQPTHGLGLGPGMLFAPEDFADAVGVGPETLRNEIIFLTLQAVDPRRDSSVKIESHSLDKDGVDVDARDRTFYRGHNENLHMASDDQKGSSLRIAVALPFFEVRQLHFKGRFLGPNRPLTTNSRSTIHSSQRESSSLCIRSHHTAPVRPADGRVGSFGSPVSSEGKKAAHGAKNG